MSCIVLHLKYSLRVFPLVTYLLTLISYDHVQDVDVEAKELLVSHPDDINEIQAKQREAIEKWEALCNLTKVRKGRLEEAYNLQKFNKDFREMVNSELLYVLYSDFYLFSECKVLEPSSYLLIRCMEGD